MHCTSEAEDETKLAPHRQRWDAAFKEYYMKEIHPEVPTTIGRWVLEGLKIFDPCSGVTNNQSESLNRVLKDLQGWNEAPIECVILSLYPLQAFYLNEVRRGIAGI